MRVRIKSITEESTLEEIDPVPARDSIVQFLGRLAQIDESSSSNFVAPQMAVAAEE